MRKWEYKAVGLRIEFDEGSTTERFDKKRNEFINKYGDMGWELVSTCTDEHNDEEYR